MTNGKWPTPWERWKADFKSHDKAPESDGAEPPTFDPPDWLEEVSKWPGALEVARRGNEHAEDGAKTAEAKAARLLQNCLTLLTIAIAVGAFQLRAAASGTWPIWVRWLLLVPPAAAVVLLAIAGAIAKDVDRVGFYRRASLNDLVNGHGSSPEVRALAAEWEGRKLARWSATNKLRDLMDARAWFTRGLTALVAAGLIAAFTFGSGQPPENPAGAPTSTTTTTAAPTITATTPTTATTSTDTTAP